MNRYGKAVKLEAVKEKTYQGETNERDTQTD
jgi:hypothetical protein